MASPTYELARIPDDVSYTDAAGLLCSALTAYQTINRKPNLNNVHTALIHGGSGAVGGIAVQLAKMHGLTVFTTCSTAKVDYVRKHLDVDAVIDYRKEDVRPVIEAHPPTVALDCIGGKLMGECFRNMVFGGRWIMIATMGGAETTINLETVWRKRIRLIGSTLRSRTPEEKSNILHALQRELWPLFTAGKLVTNIHAVFPIQQVNEAHGVLRRCENIGKVVLTMK